MDADGDYKIETLIEALHVHMRLSKLTLTLDRKVELLALATLIQNPTSKIKFLNIVSYHYDVTVDDECVDIFSRALIANSSISQLDFRLNGGGSISPAGWHSFSAALLGSCCNIEELTLAETDAGLGLGTEGINALGGALIANSSLTYLSLERQSSDIQGWEALSACLIKPDSRLNTLILYYCYIDNEGMDAMMGAVARSKALRKVQLKGIRSVMSSGWRDSFTLLLHSQCTLEDLTLSRNNIDSDGAAVLVDALAGIGTLMTPDIREGYSGVTSAGWQSFLSLLRQPSCNLERLRIGHIWTGLMTSCWLLQMISLATPA